MIYGLLTAVGFVAAVIASVAGFGIGSLLTPTMAALVPAKLAVAAVSIPHVIATAHRFLLIRKHLDRKILLSFGVMSAAGGLTGAVVNSAVTSRGLEVVLAVLVLFVGIGGLAGWMKKLRFTGGWAWLAGAVSGFLGGLVGNQGGLRAGAMMGLGVPKDAFVATATATGLIVDAARMPVYIAAQGQSLVELWPLILAMVTGVVSGTLAGMAMLRHIPEAKFMKIVSALLVCLGVWLLARPILLPTDPKKAGNVVQARLDSSRTSSDSTNRCASIFEQVSYSSRTGS